MHNAHFPDIRLAVRKGNLCQIEERAQGKIDSLVPSKRFLPVSIDAV